jgi:hypothetical protein
LEWLKDSGGGYSSAKNFGMSTARNYRENLIAKSH